MNSRDRLHLHLRRHPSGSLVKVAGGSATWAVVSMWCEGRTVRARVVSMRTGSTAVVNASKLTPAGGDDATP